MTSIKGKTVFITGASRGIGEAAAREFASLGANVAIAARNGSAVQGIAGEIGTQAVAFECDVSDAAQNRRSIDETVDRFGGLDILINNAGTLGEIGEPAAIDPAGFAEVLDVNVNGVFNGIHAALPHMKDGGTIITVGSGAATSALEGWVSYCTSKAAVHHLNACIDREYRDQGIRALILSPGTVATQMQRDIKASGIGPVAKLEWEDHIPPEWPAKAMVWMCSPDADEFLGGVVALRDEGIQSRVGLIA